MCTPGDRLFMCWHLLPPSVLLCTTQCYYECLSLTSTDLSKRLVENVVFRDLKGQRIVFMKLMNGVHALDKLNSGGGAYGDEVNDDGDTGDS
jgi:hypothetical protein